jgi:hypothetical protein
LNDTITIKIKQANNKRSLERYLYSYGVVQRIFVVCLFYLDVYGVVQGIFYFLLVYNYKDKTSKKTKAPLNDTITIKVKQAKNKSSLERHHNYKGKTSKQQKFP